MKKRIVAWLLIMTMVLGLAGCGAASAGSTAGSEGGSTAQEGSAAKTITLYPYNAGLQSGPVTGWLGDYLLEKGIILEVIPYSEEKTQAMLASGSLPDIVMCSTRQPMRKPLWRLGCCFRWMIIRTNCRTLWKTTS